MPDLVATQLLLKSLVQGAYDLQKVRIMIGNRICQQFRHQLGIKSSDDEEKLEKEKQKFLKLVREEYRLLSDGLNETKNAKLIQEMLDSKKGVISVFAEYQLATMFEDALATEKAAFENLKPIVHQFPLWNKFLVNIRGAGEVIAAIILTKIDISKAKYASSIWKLCGLDVAGDGRARGRYTEHLEDRVYFDREGNEVKTHGLTYNPWLKSKMLAVVAPCLVKANGHYKPIMDGYKNRIANSPCRQGIFTRDNNGIFAPENGSIFRVFPDGHHDQEVSSQMITMFKNNSKLMEYPEYPKVRINKMGLRYMVKIFLADVYEAWRQLENLPVHNPYYEDKMGLERHTMVLEQKDGMYAVCDARTRKPVNQIPPKKVSAIPEDTDTTDVGEARETVRQKKACGARTSKKVKDKAKAKLTEADRLAS